METPLYRSRPFRLQLLAFAWITALVFWRSWWWMMVAYPVFGLIAIFAPGMPTAVRLIGWICLVWPALVPLRSLLVAIRSPRRFQHENVVFAYPDMLAVETGPGSGYRMRFSSVRLAERLGEWYVFHLWRYRYVVIPRDAIQEGDREGWERLVASNVLRSRGLTAAPEER